jgi:hypothetical protein
MALPRVVTMHVTQTEHPAARQIHALAARGAVASARPETMMTQAPAMPAYMRRHGEFDPDPRAVRMRQ